MATSSAPSAQAAQEYIDGQSSDPRLAVIGELHSKKLWHQLTLALLEYVRDPASSRGDNLLELFERFVASFEARLDQLQLALVASQVATQLYPSRPFVVAELDAALAFLDRLGAKRARLGAAAALVLGLECTALRTRKAAAGGGISSSASNAAAAATPSAATALLSQPEQLLEDCKRELEAAKAAIDALPDGTDPVVAGTYYRVCCEFYKMRGPAHLFFESALLFLGQTPLETLALPVRQALALDVALAALVGEGVFNFGEVNAQPVLAALAGTPNAWLAELLLSFQNGDVAAFELVTATHRDALASHPALVAAEATIREKITLAALVELASRRPATERAIAFADIAAGTHVAPGAVERLVMRSFSLGLLKGSIDGVDETVGVTFVKPRVLDRAQIAQLKDQVVSWREKTATALNFLEETTTELLT